jgi:pheromone shutdown protein TraB
VPFLPPSQPSVQPSHPLFPLKRNRPFQSRLYELTHQLRNRNIIYYVISLLLQGLMNLKKKQKQTNKQKYQKKQPKKKQRIIVFFQYDNLITFYFICFFFINWKFDNNFLWNFLALFKWLFYCDTKPASTQHSSQCHPRISQLLALGAFHWLEMILLGVQWLEYTCWHLVLHNFWLSQIDQADKNILIRLCSQLPCSVYYWILDHSSCLLLKLFILVLCLVAFVCV